MANSSRFVLPSSTHPAARSFSHTVALYGGTKSSSILDAQVVFTPSTQMLSFTATGTPHRGCTVSPRCRARSASSAWASAVSGVRVMYAPTFSSTRPILSRYARVISTEDMSPCRSPSASWASVISIMLMACSSLLKGLGHGHTAVRTGGGVGQQLPPVEGRRGHVLPQHVFRGNHVGGHGHTLGIHL